MIPITLSLLTLAALGVAQNTTVSLFLPALDDQSLVGSVVGADAKATTYVITCASGGAAATTDGSMNKKKRQAAAMTTAMPTASPTGDLFDDDDSDECGLLSPLTVTEGPSTLAYTLTFGDNVAAEALSCVLSGTTKAVCGVSATVGSAAAASGFSLPSDVTVDPTATLTGSDLPSRLPVVITAGAEKLSGSTGTMTGSATNAGSTMTTGSTKAGGNSASKGSGTGTGTGTGTAAPAGSTGGAVLGFEPAMGMGVAGVVAVGLGAILL